VITSLVGILFPYQC